MRGMKGKIFPFIATLMGALVLIATSALAVPLEIYVSSKHGKVGKLDLSTGQITEEQSFTLTNTNYAKYGLVDIAFDTSGQLYGLTFDTFYKLDLASGDVIASNNFGTKNQSKTWLNALVIGADDGGKEVGYAMGYDNTNLFKMDLDTGEKTDTGWSTGWYSHGDLEWDGNDNLILAGGPTGRDESFLIDLDPVNQTVDSAEAITDASSDEPYNNVYALAYIDDTMYGILNNTDNLTYDYFTIDLATGAATLLGTEAFGDFGPIYGSAVKASPTPEPATMMLVGVGLIGIAGIRRRISKS